MNRTILSTLLFAALTLPGWATRISNVQVDLLKAYSKGPINTTDTAINYMGRITYTFVAEGKDSVFLDFCITKKDSLDSILILEKTGDVGCVKQNNAGDTVKTIYFRSRLINDVSGNYVATITANATMSAMWKLADSLAGLMNPLQKQQMLYAYTGSQLLANFGSDDMTIRNNTLIVGWRCSDGPHGVRWPIGPASGIAIYGAGDTMTLFATEAALGCTWDVSMAWHVGQAIAQEARAMGLYCNLGPMSDLVINPRWGRAFETMGEDPVLNGNMVANQVQGLQSERVIATSKHFTPYLQETNRMAGLLVVVSERALRELFCVPFEMAVKVGGERALMTCYNKVRVPGFTTSNPTEISDGAEQAGSNRHLIQDIVRNDWGFDGIIMTDWLGAANVTPESYVYNTDFDMSMPNGAGLTNSAANVASHLWDTLPLYKKAARCMYDRLWAWGGKLLTNANQINTYPKSVILSPEHKAVALAEAEESIVLAKNDSVGGAPVLPLDKNATFTLAVLGPFANTGRQGGGGSSAVTPDSIITPYQGITKLLTAYPNVSVVLNPANYTGVDAAVVCVGVDAESEGMDRPSYSLPSISGVDQNALVSSVMGQVPKTIVVYTGGSASCAGAWSTAPGVLIAFYPGRSQGQALAEVLFGDVNPSGHLNVTFPGTINDLPPYGGLTVTLLSADSAHGYFYFDKTSNTHTPLFWFGHGLSYTTFTYNTIWVVGSSTITAGDRIDVNVDLTNSGARAGDEVVQLYVKPNTVNATFHRRVKDLRGFQRISLGAGEEKLVTFTLGPRDFSVYDADSTTKTGQWRILTGSYDLIAGSTSNPVELVNGNGKCVTTTITVQ